MRPSDSTNTPTRRDFLMTSGRAAAAAGVAAMTARTATGAEGKPLRIGLIGCGRRGLGAVRNCFDADPDVTLVAAGDLFGDHMADAREKLAAMGDRVKLDDSSCFTGFDAGDRVIASDVDIVLMCQPPAFRPAHLRAAVEAGRHVFMEKPAAVCPAGVRSIMETAKLADKKGLSIVAGTQRRHQKPYQEIIRRIQDGAIGEIVSAACYWIGDFGYYPAVLRKEGWSDVEWQIRNWNYFTWLSGDHIVEQHLHNLDVINWIMGAPPVKCLGMGGRQQRTGPEYGHIFDHFAVEYEYPGGVRVQSLCRQMENTDNRVTEYVAGTLGSAVPGNAIQGKNKYVFKGDQTDPYVQEHADLIACIRANKPVNEAHGLAESTLTAIMGRMSAYTGQEVTWKWALEKSELDLTPKALSFGELAVPPVAVPGVMKLA